MQRRHALRDDQWERIEPALPGKLNDPSRTCPDNRLFVEAVMWITKTGAPWRGKVMLQNCAESGNSVSGWNEILLAMSEHSTTQRLGLFSTPANMHFKSRHIYFDIHSFVVVSLIEAKMRRFRRKEVPTELERVLRRLR